jgi:hypothetical protein
MQKELTYQRLVLEQKILACKKLSTEYICAYFLPFSQIVWPGSVELNRHNFCWILNHIHGLRIRSRIRIRIYFN